MYEEVVRNRAVGRLYTGDIHKPVNSRAVRLIAIGEALVSLYTWPSMAQDESRDRQTMSEEHEISSS